MKVLAPATSANLGPGFDCLGLCLKYYNQASVSVSNFHSISVEGECSEKINLKKHNPFVSIFNDVFSELSGKNEKFRFEFLNKIPLSRGLGSSSAMIVSAISLAYGLAGFKIKKDVILNKALVYENHPDNIAPTVHGGFVASICNDNGVLLQRAEISDDIVAVVVIPDFSMGTRESRAKLPNSYTKKETINNVAHSSFLTACFMAKDYENLRFGCKDMMHEDRRMADLPQLFDIRKLAYDNGALMSSLSGSGSSFLNIVYRDDAKSLSKILKDKFSNFRIEIFDFDNNGFIIQD